MNDNKAAKIIPEIISQHYDEASFLWLLRDGAVSAPHYALKDLAKLDGRVKAHIDGLRIAGDPGWELIEQGLEQADAGGIFAAAVIAFESLQEDRMQLVVETGIAAPDLPRGLISALGWLNLEQALPLFSSLLVSEDSLAQSVGIGAAAVHRYALPNMERYLKSDNADVRARAIRLAGQLGDRKYIPSVTSCLNDADETCRFRAAYAAVLLGAHDGIEVLRHFAKSGGAFAEEAAELTGRALPLAESLAWHKVLAATPETLRLSLKVAGAMGDPVIMPWIMEQMHNPEMARVAGEAFTSITGVDIAYNDLEGELPEGFEAGPNDNPEDENVAMDPDENLPCPDPALIVKWWGENQRRFKAGKRYLLGRPIASDTVQTALREGKQRQRAAAALEMVLLSPAQPLFEVRARGDLQKRALGV